MDILTLRKLVNEGKSFSEISRLHNINVGKISRICKSNNIISKHMDKIKPKDLPIEEIYTKYQNGSSLDALMKEYNAPIARIKKYLLKKYPDIHFRSMNEAKRPFVLNDRNEFEKLAKTMSFRKIAKIYGVKANTVCDAGKRFDIKSAFDLEIANISYEELNELYVIKGLSVAQIASFLNKKYGLILNRLRKYGFIIKPQGGVIRPSKHYKLNDRDWLLNKYANGASLTDIANEIGTTVGNIAHHLKKHSIKMRSKSAALSMMLSRMHGNDGKYNDVRYSSLMERNFLKKVLDGVESKDIQRNVELSSNGSMAFIDYSHNGKFYEIKSKETSEHPGPNRRRLIKQFLVCKNNNINLNIWNGNFCDILVADEDIYCCSNWKLIFNSSDECFKWLVNYGFRGVMYSIHELNDTLRHIQRVKAGSELNANYPNEETMKLIKHFSQHFWHSTHKDYLPVSAAWEHGNQVVLKNAIEKLWNEKNEVNLYGLVKIIQKFFKDFTSVSIFKPWVARFVYNKFLGDNGVIIDPCMGWGGRLLATVDTNYKYIGYDLNENAVNSHGKLRKYIGSRINVEPTFLVGDASKIDFPNGDLLFTSPPYDNTEHYFGIDSKNTQTEPILDNIFRKFNGIIGLNIPIRQRELCISIAKRYRRNMVDELKMKTASFMGRERTHEPILFFSRR